ncbi:MAG: arsenate reductase ArsC [Thermodesulfobacteriota bacterium]
MSERVYNVLFVCTGNSARSIMAECALRRFGLGRFRAFSAGSKPAGVVHPVALDVLRSLDHDTSTLRSKSWDEFARPDAPPLDFVFTVCDRARGEACPVWPGRPISAHWGASDPAAFVGSPDATRRLFTRIYTELESRVRLFAALRIEQLDQMTLRRRLDDIGRHTPPG